MDTNLSMNSFINVVKNQDARAKLDKNTNTLRKNDTVSIPSLDEACYAADFSAQAANYSAASAKASLVNSVLLDQILENQAIMNKLLLETNKKVNEIWDAV